MSHLAITWAMTLQFTTEKNSKLFAASAAIKYNLTKERQIMEDYFENFDDFGENGFTDEDSFEDNLEGEFDEPFADEPDHEDEPDKAESQDDDFTAKVAFILGGAMGFAYEEGLREGKRRKRKKISDDSE
jgi:hypothetical protein